MTCKDCVHYAPCFSGGVSGWNNIEQTEDDHCPYFKNKADVVEVVRCKDCEHSRELEKNCEINNREHYRHCAMYRGEEERVWVKYKRYYKDYSIVEFDDFCNYGERKCEDG